MTVSISDAYRLAIYDKILGQTLYDSFVDLEDAIDLIDGGAGGGTGLGWYDVSDHGLVPDDEASAAANRTALRTLLDTVRTAGGGTIYFPESKWYISTPTGAGDVNLSAIRFQAHNNIVLRGDGSSSKIVWTGDLSATSKHLFWISGGYTASVVPGITRVTTKNIVFRDLWIGSGNITNRDTGSEQNHLIRILPDQRGDVTGVKIINCTFGYVPGDAVAMVGDSGGANGGQLSIVGDVLIDGNTFDSTEHEASVAQGIGFRCCVSNSRCLRNIRIVNNHFTGSDDALIDCEPTGGVSANNGIHGWVCANNTFLPYAPGGGDAYRAAVHLGGNDEADGGYLQEWVFANNTIKGGRIFTTRSTRGVIANNVIYTDTGASAVSQGAIYGVDRVETLTIANNQIYCIAGFGGANAIEVYNETLPANEQAMLNIVNNEISVHTDCQQGILIESMSAIIANNSITNYSTEVDTGTAIYHRSTSNDCDVLITGNKINGDLGGGSFEFGILIWPDDNDSQYNVTGNMIRGCASRDIRVTAVTGSGTYRTIPVITGNSCAGTGVGGSSATLYWVAAGNNGGITHTVGGSTSTPESLVTALRGSRHTVAAGSSTITYYKTTNDSNTGWVREGGVRATGTIGCTTKANYADTDFMTIGDGYAAPKVYEFDTAGDGVTAGRIQVNISADTTADSVATTLKTAIEANQPSITIVRTGGNLALTHKMPGVIGNVTITENVANAAHTVTGMSGGVDDPTRG